MGGRQEVDHLRLTLDQKKRQYRLIYESIYRNPRIFIKDIASILKIDRNTAAKRLQEAFEDGFVLIPQLRKLSFGNFKEYMYVFNSKNPLRAYLDYIENQDVVYHAELLGSFNFWIVTRDEIDIGGSVILEGPRSDYFVTYAPNQSWTTAIEKMHIMVENFDIAEYNPRGIIKTRWNKTVGWDSEFELLYREFKYNVRQKQTPLRKKYLISGMKLEKWYKEFPEYCTVFTRYFPDGFSAYDPYLLIFETDYEDFLIDLFSELPTSSFFFKVADKLFLYADVPRQYIRSIDLHASVNRLHIPLLVEDLLRRGIIKSHFRSIIEYSWGKDL